MLVISVLLFAPNLTAEGLRLFDQGKYLEARRSLEQVLQASPGDAHAKTFLALSRAATGECAAVERDLAAIANADGVPANLKRLSALGHSQCLISASRLDEAAAVISRLRAEYPGDADVLYQSAKVHMRAWNDVVQEMFARAPASWRVNQLSAEIFEIQGRYDDAIGEYKKALAKNSAAINLNYRLGRALLMRSHSPEALDEALRAFEAELALNPNDAVALYQTGQIHLAKQQSEEAGKRFRRAIELNPSFAEAYVAAGKLRGGEEAIRLFERAVELQPRNESARYNLMLAYRNAGRAADARKQKAELDRIQRPPEGEFTEFLKRIGEKPKQP